MPPQWDRDSDHALLNRAIVIGCDKCPLWISLVLMSADPMTMHDHCSEHADSPMVTVHLKTSKLTWTAATVHCRLRSGLQRQDASVSLLCIDLVGHTTRVSRCAVMLNQIFKTAKTRYGLLDKPNDDDLDGSDTDSLADENSVSAHQTNQRGLNGAHITVLLILNVALFIISSGLFAASLQSRNGRCNGDGEQKTRNGQLRPISMFCRYHCGLHLPNSILPKPS